MMLQQIKRDPAALIQGDDFAVEERICRERHAGTGDMWELLGEEVFFS